MSLNGICRGFFGKVTGEHRVITVSVDREPELLNQRFETTTRSVRMDFATHYLSQECLETIISDSVGKPDSSNPEQIRKSIDQYMSGYCKSQTGKVWPDC